MPDYFRIAKMVGEFSQKRPKGSLLNIGPRVSGLSAVVDSSFVGNTYRSFVMSFDVRSGMIEGTHLMDFAGLSNVVVITAPTKAHRAMYLV
jgi:hypothetical protein